MGGLGDAFADAVVAIAIAAFCAGVAATGVAWLLWHFVLSHITLGWH